MRSMSEYQVSIDPNVLATVNDELARQEEHQRAELQKREEQQRRQYAFLTELQEMTRELPSRYQQKMSPDLLVGLAKSLLDGTVFQIISGISELQRMEEENLFNTRKKLVADFADEKQTLLAGHKERIYKCAAAPHNRPMAEKQNKEEYDAFEKRRREEIINCDKRVIGRLDGKIHDQQNTLMKAGVAGFYTTDNPEEIRLQMYILDFIARLSSSGI